MSNSDQKHHGHLPKFLLWDVVVIGIIALLLGGYYLYTSNNTEATTTATQPLRLALSNDETQQQDSLQEDAVNRERLGRLLNRNDEAPVDTTALGTEINSIIGQNPDITFGVSIKDITTASVHNYGNQKAMTAASVTKVLTAADYLKQVELGKKSLSTITSNGVSAQKNIEQMIVVSDNDAWHILNDALTYPQLQEYARSIGLSSYQYNGNVISSSDTAKLFGDLYERKLINESNSQLLLSYMERANYRDLIIPAVPTADTTYHKAGEYLINLNDSAIITNDTKAIVLSIYTQSNSSYSKKRVAGLMQQITTPTLTTFGLN